MTGYLTSIAFKLGILFFFWLFSHITYLTFVYKVIILHKFAYFDCSQAVSLSWGGWGSNPSRRHLVISADILGCHN